MSLGCVVEGSYGSDGRLKLEKGLGSLIYLESIYGLATFKLKASAFQWNEWDSVAIHESSLGNIRWGVQGPEGITWSEYRNISIPAGKMRYSKGLALAQVSGVDFGWLMKLSRANGEVFKRMTIADMVKKIVGGSRPVDIAATRDKYTLYRCGLSDLDFISQVLLPRAVGVDGRADFMFYFEHGDKLIFKPPDYKQKPTYRFSIATNAGGFDSRGFDHLDVELRRFSLEDLNSWNVEIRGFDILNKKPIYLEMNDDTVPYEKLAPKTPEPHEVGERATKSIAVTDPGIRKYRRVDFESLGHVLWQRNHRQRYRVALPVSGLVDAVPGKLVSLSIVDSEGKDHFSSGLWLIYAVKHKVFRTKFQTVLFLERRNSR